MNKRLEFPEVATLYKAKFDNYPKPIPNSFDGGPLKHASNLGAVAELEQGMTDAIHKGQPMDFNAFARMLNERSVGAAKVPLSTSATQEVYGRGLDDTPGLCFTQLMREWERSAGQPR